MPENVKVEQARYDLKLAWKRVKSDRKNRCFVVHPHLIQVIENDLDDWLASIAQNISNGYTPFSAVVCYEPKPGWLLRPGCMLHVNDELIYTALVGHILPQIEPSLRWSQGNPDTSYLLQQNYKMIEWVRSGFGAWDNFRKKSVEAAKENKFVVSIDIAAFYENIDIGRLVSDIRNVNSSPDDINLLSKCLNRWAEPRGKGIPQGYTASDILAKLYLNSIDQAIKNEGFYHLRYVDDIRVFCKTIKEAKLSLHLIIDRLRLRGLNVQSAKTEILKSKKAIIEFDGVTPIIRDIAQELSDELKKYGAVLNYSMSLSELTRIISQSADSPSFEALERAFITRFIKAPNKAFNRTLFHYLLTRLGLIKSNLALDYCLKLLQKRPEETKFILKYFIDIEIDSVSKECLINCISSKNADNDYQCYQILKFLFETKTNDTKIIVMARKLIRDRNLPLWVRSYAYALIGRLGTVSDFEYLQSLYSSAENSIEKTDIILAMNQYERGLRNSVLSRFINDGIFEAHAVKIVMQESYFENSKKLQELTN